MEQGNEKKEMYQARERYRSKAFYIMVETAVIIAVPAFVAFLVGGRLDADRQGSRTYTLILLFASFVLSWAIIIKRYISFSRRVKSIDKKIKELKDKENGSSSDIG